MELPLVKVLFGVHELLEHDVLDEIAGHVGVERARVGGEALLGGGACLDELIHEVVDRRERLQPERCDQMIVLAGNRHHLGGTEDFSVAHERFHDASHGLALRTVEDGLLLLG